MHYCDQCDKKYKTSRSLVTHNSRFHPYSKKVKYSDNASDNTSQKSESDEDRSTDIKQYSQIMKNKFDLTLLKDDVDRLTKRVWGLDMEMVVPNLTHQTGGGSKILDNNKIHKEELETIKDQSSTNKVKLSTIEDKLENLVESSQEKNRVAVEDLIDDLKDVKELFINQHYEELLSDIPRLRLVAKLVISVMDNVDMGDITEGNIKLLEEIGDSSKAKVKMLLKEKFNTLVGIFTKLKIDELYDEESYADKSDSEGMDKEHFNRSQSDDDSDSDSADESGSERSDEDRTSNKEHSDGDKSDSDSSNGEDSDNGTSESKNSDIASSSGEQADLVGGSDSENSNNTE
jgi:hypothetical protein